ncbi:MAG TPA: lamin tail domain-containing protein [Longimicrobium sp.]|nr:lamin tail domain-containing protein [Longimicrobium sp.]
MRFRRTPAGLAPGLLALALGACDAPTEIVSRSPSPTSSVVVPAQGTATTLDIAGWNVEWFGDASNGPSNDALQLSNVRDVIAGADADVWGMVEVVDGADWSSLKSQLSGYAGVLANDASVTSGSTYYSATEQKVGLLYKSSIATVLSSRIILTANDYDFAGRPPLEVTLRITLNGSTQDVVFIVLHMKAFNDVPSWQRRQNAAVALKNYIDTTYPTQKVVVVGDWNDDVDTSITSGQVSPFANFVGDAADYTYPTGALSAAGVASTVSYSDFIDHHLNTNDLYADYVAGSAQAFRADTYVSSYGTTTSDHFPVISRYNHGTPGLASVTVTSPNGGESWPGGSARNITWTSSGVTNVKLEYTLDGTTWSTITASTAASAGSYAWTVPSSASTTAKVRVSDAGGTASDVSDAAFTITTATPANVIINEILANEPGSNTAGEFVEIVNIGGTSISIAGWTISDGGGLRHTFAAGTTLAAGKAIVVFGGSGSIPAGLTNAVAASTGQLNLANGGDSVILKDGGGVVKNSYSYGSSLSGTDGVSMNRSPDATTGSFVLHTTLGSLQSSAGKRVNGTAF